MLVGKYGENYCAVISVTSLGAESLDGVAPILKSPPQRRMRFGAARSQRIVLAEAWRAGLIPSPGGLSGESGERAKVLGK